MDINVYLPDELGARAKEAGLKFSALLRAAVESELTQMETQADSTVHELVIEDKDGYQYVVRLHATVLALNGRDDAMAFLTEDGRLVVYAKERLEFFDEIEGQLPIHFVDYGVIDDESSWLSMWFSDGEVVEVMRRLGKRAVIEIGKAS